MKLPATSLLSRLWIGVLLVNLFIYALLVLLLYQSRQQYERQAILTTQNLARPLAVNVTGVLEKN